MPSQPKKNTSSRAQSGKRDGEHRKAGTEKDSEALTDTAEAAEAARQYVRGLLVRGEAVKPEDGKLPPGATHEIVEEKGKELPTVRRKRFSAY